MFRPILGLLVGWLACSVVYADPPAPRGNSGPSLFDETINRDMALRGCVHKVEEVLPGFCEKLLDYCRSLPPPRSFNDNFVCNLLESAVRSPGGVLPLNPAPPSGGGLPGSGAAVKPARSVPPPASGSIEELIARFRETQETFEDSLEGQWLTRIRELLPSLSEELRFKDMLKLMLALQFKARKTSFRIRKSRDGWLLLPDKITKTKDELVSLNVGIQLAIYLFYLDRCLQRLAQSDYRSLSEVRAEMSELRTSLRDWLSKVDLNTLPALKARVDSLDAAIAEVDSLFEQERRIEKLLTGSISYVEIRDAVFSFFSEKVSNPGGPALREFGARDVAEKLGRPGDFVIGILVEHCGERKRRFPGWSAGTRFSALQNIAGYLYIGAVEGLVAAQSADPGRRLSLALQIESFRLLMELDRPVLGEEVRWFISFQDARAQFQAALADLQIQNIKE